MLLSLRRLQWLLQRPKGAPAESESRLGQNESRTTCSVGRPVSVQFRNVSCQNGPRTISEALAVVKDRLTAHIDEEEAHASANILVAHALGHKTVFAVDKHQKLSSTQWRQILHLTEKRRKRVPVQYIIGEWDFLDFTLKMKPPVLVPRPETEELVKLIQNDTQFSESRNFLEIGCGSGAISVALLKNNSQLQGVAVDICEEACSLTRENATLHKINNNLSVHKKSVTDSDFPEFLRNNIPFDFIVSNPPYIPSGQIETLQDEVRLFESHLALDGGEDGLTIIRNIIHHAPYLLKDQGSVWLEVDQTHPNLVWALCSRKNSLLELVDIFEDFQQM